MATSPPRRRSTDSRPPRAPSFGPAPGGMAPPDAEAVTRSIALALDSARRTRRPLTVVALALPRDAAPDALDAVAVMVRHTVRDTDGLWRDGPEGLILVLTDVDGPNCEPPLARLRLRLRREGFGDALMGRAAPAPGISAAALLELVRAELRPISFNRRPG